MLAHANIKPRSSGCRSDSGLVFDAVDKTRTIKREEIFLSAVACFRWFNMYVVLSQHLRIVAFDDGCHVTHTAMADFHIVSVKYLV